MSAAQLLDPATIEEARAMFKAKFPTMAGYYLEDAAGYVDNIRQAVMSGNVQAIVTPAHTLKSSSRQMGAFGVSDIAKEIEAEARAGAAVDWFARQLTRLEEAFEQTRASYPAA
jgi:HPt (histidine-containing phosphotransfer) domain-containing protein